MSSPAAVRVKKKLPPLRRTARVAEPIRGSSYVYHLLVPASVRSRTTRGPGTDRGCVETRTELVLDVPGKGSRGRLEDAFGLGLTYFGLGFMNPISVCVPKMFNARFKL